MHIKELTKALKIDREDLDGAVSEQPELYYHVSLEAARAASRRDQAKDQLKVVEADLNQQVRKELLDAGEKVTEKGLEHMVTAHQDRADAVADLLNAAREAEEWQALKESFQQRSYMLRELAALTVHQLMSSGSISQSVGDLNHQQIVADMANSERRRKMNEKRKVRTKVRR